MIMHLGVGQTAVNGSLGGTCALPAARAPTRRSARTSAVFRSRRWPPGSGYCARPRTEGGAADRVYTRQAREMRGLDDSAGPPAFVQDGSGEKPPRGAGLDAPEVRWVSRRRRGGGPSLASIGSTVTADGPCPASG